MKHIFLSIVVAGFMVSCGGTKNPELARLETEKEVLSLNTKLNKLQIELTKEREAYASLSSSVDALNTQADDAVRGFSTSYSAKTTAQDASKTARLLNKTEKANKNLVKSERKINDLQEKIQKIQQKLEAINLRRY